VAGSPTEQEQAALEILLHESRRERIQLRVGRLGDSEVAFIVYVLDSGDAAETERDRIFPLAVVLDEKHQKYVDVSRSRLPTSVMLGALEAAREEARTQAEALEAQADRVEELILELEAARRARKQGGPPSE
jgi:hypothetical protein